MDVTERYTPIDGTTTSGQENDALRGGKRRVPCHTNRQDG